MIIIMHKVLINLLFLVTGNLAVPYLSFLHLTTR